MGLSPRHTALLAVLFVVGLALGQSGRADGVAMLVADVYRAYVQAEYIMLQARQNVAADGLVEYAVMVDDQARLVEFAAAREQSRVRASAVPGWQVVAVPPEQQEGLELLRKQPFVTVAWRNRGLWICH